jgi:hypothetical protein
MEEETNDVIAVQSISVIEGQSRAETDIAISTAKKYPRLVKRAVDNSIAVITRDPEFAKSCVYSLPRGGKAIEGPSVHLARLLASQYGNLRVDSHIVEIGDTTVTAQSTAFDLESNFAIRTEVKRRITDKQGQRFNEDLIVVTCNAALAIASRNAILQVIPAQCVNSVYKAAKSVILGDVSTDAKLLQKRKEILDGFLNTYNVSEAEVLSLLELETVNQIRENELLTLAGLAQALKDGDTTVAESFGRNTSGISKESRSKTKEIIEKARAKRSQPKSGNLI